MGLSCFWFMTRTFVQEWGCPRCERRRVFHPTSSFFPLKMCDLFTLVIPLELGEVPKLPFTQVWLFFKTNPTSVPWLKSRGHL